MHSSQVTYTTSITLYAVHLLIVWIRKMQFYIRGMRSLYTQEFVYSVHAKGPLIGLTPRDVQYGLIPVPLAEMKHSIFLVIQHKGYVKGVYTHKYIMRGCMFLYVYICM